MLIYIILLIITIIFSINIEKYKNNKLGKILAIILLFILSLVAGARTIELGWDAQKYVASTFFRLNYFDGDYSSFMDETTVEYGFSLLSYLLYKIKPDVNLLLFAYSFVTTALIFIFGFIEKKNIKFSNLLIVYFFTLFLVSFNIIRQSIAVGFALVAFSYLKKNKKILCTIFTILTCMFHSSGIFVLLIYLLYAFIGDEKNKSKRVFKVIILILFTLFFCFLYEYVVKIVYSIGLIPYKYYEYMISFDRIDYNLSNIGVMLYWLIVSCMALKSNPDEKYKKKILFESLLFFIALAINIVSIQVPPIYRMGFYFYYIGLFNFVGSFDLYFKNVPLNGKILKILSSVLLICLFLWITVLANSYNIYPYKSNIL